MTSCCETAMSRQFDTILVNYAVYPIKQICLSVSVTVWCNVIKYLLALFDDRQKFNPEKKIVNKIVALYKENIFFACYLHIVFIYCCISGEGDNTTVWFIFRKGKKIDTKMVITCGMLSLEKPIFHCKKSLLRHKYLSIFNRDKDQEQFCHYDSFQIVQRLSNGWKKSRGSGNNSKQYWDIRWVLWTSLLARRQLAWSFIGWCNSFYRLSHQGSLDLWISLLCDRPTNFGESYLTEWTGKTVKTVAPNCWNCHTVQTVAPGRRCDSCKCDSLTVSTVFLAMPACGLYARLNILTCYLIIERNTKVYFILVKQFHFTNWNNYWTTKSKLLELDYIHKLCSFLSCQVFLDPYRMISFNISY